MNRTVSTVARLSHFVRLAAFVMLAASYAPSLHAQEECEDVSGVWAVGLNLPGSGQNEVIVTLEQAECAVTGLVEGRNSTPIEGGEVEGATATFTAMARNMADGQGLGVAWVFTVEENEVHGTLSSPMMGPIEFEGTRVPR